jgi:hypothetical protein
MKTKICTKCQQELLDTEEYFNKHPQGKFGLNSKCKACEKEYKRKYYQENKGGKIKDYIQNNKDIITKKQKKHNKEYRKNNRNKLLEQSKQYYEDNKEQFLTYHKEYYKKNKERILEYHQEYYQKNKDGNIKGYLVENKDTIKKKKKEYDKKHRAKNKAYYRAASKKYKTSKKNQVPEFSNLKLIQKIYEYCPEGYQVDHMIPLSKGGLHWESNLCYLPAPINSSKRAKSIEEFGVEIFLENVIYWQEVLVNF